MLVEMRVSDCLISLNNKKGIVTAMYHCQGSINTFSDGLAACRELSKESIKTNVTLIFSAAQAVLASAAKAA